MQLTTLLQSKISISDQYNREIKGLALDSRQVKQGDLFFAYRGTHLDGRQFIDDAIQKGAAVILSEGDTQILERKNVPVIYMPNLASHIGSIAAKFYGSPSKKMKVIGITGTNGKTSCSHFIASALNEMNQQCGVIGTLGNGLYGAIQAGNLTTPDAVTLQKTLDDFVQSGANYTAMEVSSHSIDQSRINGIDFAVSIFTNLTRDHLDYHGTMENYGNAKKKLFESDATQYSVINADDEFGRKIIAELQDKKPVYAYSTKKQDIKNLTYADQIHLDSNGIHARIHSLWGEGDLTIGLIGQFNLSNVLAVLTTLCLLGIPFETVCRALETLRSVEGRMQTLGGKQKPLVVVDYAHTPDALEKVLMALRHHCHGKLYCVFGCGGDRDRGKRPLMAKIAEQAADSVFVTDDNPRTEDPEQIFSDITGGFTHPDKIQFQHDRAKTIRDVIQSALPGDCILIAGKGAETYQIIGERKYPFSDIEQVKLHV